MDYSCRTWTWFDSARYKPMSNCPKNAHRVVVDIDSSLTEVGGCNETSWGT